MKTLFRSTAALLVAAGSMVGWGATVGSAHADAAAPVPTVKLAMNYKRLTYGTKLEVATQVAYAGSGVYDGSITLQAKTAGSSSWSVARTTTDGTTWGYWTLKPAKNTAYRVVYSGYTATSSYETTYAAATSPTVSVLVERNFHAVIGAATLRFHGTVGPAYAKRSVTIQRASCASCAFKRFKAITTTSTSRWSINLPAVHKRTFFRALIPAGGGFARSISPVAYTVRY